MKKALLLSSVALICLLFSCGHERSGKPRVLIFTKAAGYVHASIPNGVAAIKKLGAENGFEVDTTSNAGFFTQDSLDRYAAVIFLHTTGNILDYRQEAAFERYIQAGGSYVGIHAAADCEYDWGWYGRLAGGWFSSHPEQQTAKFIIKDKNFGATSFFTDSVWTRKDELYNYKKLSPDIHVILTIDESTYKGGTNGAFHPMAWYHEYDGGRAFYTALGHTEESWTEENYLKHLLGGIKYAIGDNKSLDYSKAKTQLPPDEDRFSKTTLVKGEFFEPTEMTILPNFDILVTQRRGELMLYKNETKQVKQAGLLKVYWKTEHTPGVNAEEGVMGLAKDPNFAKNNRIYIYYSPADSSVNRLSRFTFRNDTLDLSTEKVILEVKSQREICCHTGGSIAFGPDGLLYFSTGDNSTPFDEPKQRFVNSGFAPLNDDPGHQQYDARRSSGNTNDLRGKIIRIKVNEDGTYDIPEGNLFAKGTDKTRPEIYVMGNRNPYRISVDQKNGNLYWGEVGPDAANDSLDTRGPRGYDEVNQARKAGFFGWPLFVGNNYPYHTYNYSTGATGPSFDPQKPINESRNNTGLKELPPAQPAFIWYPYAVSRDFPQVGTGGRNAMAGPVYYTDMYPKETRLPDYYNGKLIIYDWIRGWIKAVTMLPNGDYDKMEPFFESIKLNSLIDMEAGPDGKLYLLEYGSGWFSKNEDAGLSRIDYNYGNIAPKITSSHINKTSGTLPFAVKVSAEAHDADHGTLSYIWNFGDGTTKETSTPEIDHTYTNPGDYKVSLEVKDNGGASSKQDIANVYAGNQEPVVNIQLTGGNRSFYLPGRAFTYDVKVTDNDTAKTDPANFYVSTEYVAGYDKASSTLGHQQGQAAVSGRSLTQTLDGKSCHKETDKSVGPAFILVAKKYKGVAGASAYLSEKIIKGGKGVWGETAMSAHPNLSETDVHTIVSWVLSLAADEKMKKSLPASGSIVPISQQPGNWLVMTASYTDKGGNNTKALTGTTTFALPSNYRPFNGREEVKGFEKGTQNGNAIVRIPKTDGWFAVDSLDLTGVKSVNTITRWRNTPAKGYMLEVRLDSPDGKSLGRGAMPVPGNGAREGQAHIPLLPTEDGKYHKLYFIYKGNPDNVIQANIALLQFNGK